MGSILLLDLMGGVALLIWGLHMIRSGIIRAFGPDLRRFLGTTLRNRLLALLAGVGVTALLQSGTATALMGTSFASRDLVDLVPALAIMLGANIGTTLIVQALSFNVSAMAPVLILMGVAAFKLARRQPIRDLGRVAIGLGLMLLALHVLLDTLTPAGNAPIVRALIETITEEPILCVVIAYEAIKLYVTRVSRESLDDHDGRRAMEIISFAINLEHIGDIIDKNLIELAIKKIRHRYEFSKEGAAELAAFHKRIIDNLKLALSVFMYENVKVARTLIEEKMQLRVAELASADSHLARLREGRPESIETSSLHLDLLRDLKRIHSHICSVAYPVLEATGELQPSRLRDTGPTIITGGTSTGVSEHATSPHSDGS